MTILRKAEYLALRGVALSGRVVDLGGDKRSEYQRLFKGDFSIVTANMSKDSAPDIFCDLEQTLPIENTSFDGVLLINVLEHIFEYRQLLTESARILRPHGTIVIVVPFIFPYHPSPNDFHRYTKTALERALAASRFSDIEVQTLGSGVCSARWMLLQRLLPWPLHLFSIVVDPLVSFCDSALTALAKGLGKKYVPSDYALGYMAVARKKS